jgi:putative transposase
MPNHVHFVMVPRGVDGLRATFGEAHRRYTRHINLREDWQGYLWQDRFHSTVMDETHLIMAIRCVELNPVHAGLCDYPWQWQWSSAMAHLPGENDTVAQVTPMLERISDWKSYLHATENETEQNVIRQHARAGRPQGSGDFVAKLERLTNTNLRLEKRGPRPRLKKSILSPN